MFNTGEFKEFESKNYITPGVHEVEIVSVTSDNDEYLEIASKIIGEDDDTAMSKRFYFKGDSGQYSGGKIKSILKACLPEGKTVVEAATLKEFAAKLNAVLAGKQYRQKFTGREYVSENEVKVAAEYPIARKKEIGGVEYSLIVESINKGTAYPMVPVEASNLTYDKSNQYDFRQLSEEDRPTSEQDASAEAGW